MIKHIVFYDHIDGLTNAERKEDATLIKTELEGLQGVIPGLTEMIVYSDLLNSGNADIVLYSVFESRDALEAYKDHPEHVRVATTIVRPRVTNRRCADFSTTKP